MPNASIEIGWMGFLYIICGFFGSAVAGYILDVTHRFKETCMAFIFLSILSYAVFAALLEVHLIWVQFITIALFGIFLPSIMSIGYEYGVELTYPDSEYVCSCLLNLASCVIYICLTNLLTFLLENTRPLASHCTVAAVLVISCITASFLTSNYKRNQKDTVDSSS